MSTATEFITDLEEEEVDVENSHNTLWKSPGAKHRFEASQIFEHIARLRYNPNTEIAVGTDSQHRGQYLFYITVICLWERGRGGTYYYKSECQKRQPHMVNSSQKMRMFEEVSRTIEIANLITEKTGIKPVCHIDASLPIKKEYTSSFSEQLRGYVISSGYICVLKPESYAANCIADRHTKRKLRIKETT
ncbi:hypothetical protein EBU71_10340 [bacterium]|jgi:predicted RNase H-related nuclease YkuK (DUF458 family)|nr:hypothetical protein [Candidatus Elulimicrobium humile]